VTKALLQFGNEPVVLDLSPLSPALHADWYIHANFLDDEEFEDVFAVQVNLTAMGSVIHGKSRGLLWILQAPRLPWKWSRRKANRASFFFDSWDH
jgi:hypothetical protein